MNLSNTFISSRAILQVALLFTLNFNIIFSKDIDKGNSFNYQCLWVVRDALQSRKSIDDLINFASEKNINDLFVQVRGRGDALYKSQMIPRSQLLPSNEFDPLSYLLQNIKDKGIKVHAWVNVYLIWSNRTMPIDKKHIIYNNEDWVDTIEEWPLNINRQLNRVSRNNEGEGVFLAPNHPEVSNYLVSVFKEIIDNYEIDGLHLDYIRYQDADYGRNPYAIAKFKKDVGRDPNPWFLEMERSNVASQRLIGNLKQWNNAKRSSITNLVKEIKELINDTRPNIMLSAAVKPNLYVARERFLQEWDVWLAAGYVDWVVPMNYSPIMSDFSQNISVINDNFPKKYRDKIIMGIALYNQSSVDAAKKIKYSIEEKFVGISVFSYNQMKSNSDYSSLLDKINEK
ncbi:MAG: hypothetical protein CMG65_01640 [Candidatus Marinimicrobia bacterium]|nr:hypothetical protein [Candidatus Neomarinimicrobiota bacterium]MBI66479.1 hypothetical protein [Candidatus Neomarinimicrobiota bacterium]